MSTLVPVAATLVCRHGDRSPTFNSFEPLTGLAAQEAATWLGLLPSPSLIDELDARFPTDATSKQRDDSLGRPFGSLSSLGILQMRRLGKIVADLFPSPKLAQVRVTSSDFRRTQLSAKGVLAGLGAKLPRAGLGTVVSSSGQAMLNAWGVDPILRRLIKANGLVDVVETSAAEEHAKQVILRAVPAFGFNLRPFSWLAVLDHTMSREGKTGGGGPLRGRPVPSRVHELFSLAALPNTSGAYALADVRGAVSKILLSPSQRDLDAFFSTLTASAAGGVVTVDALRAFVAGLRLPVPQGGVSEEAYWDAAQVVESAVCKRFDAMLSISKVGYFAAGGIARRITEGLERSLAEWRTDGLPRVEVFSAHDVTLVPLLKLMGCWSSSSPWPGMASALVFTLYADADGSHPCATLGFYSGVRHAKSGLEPAPWEFETIVPQLDSVVADKRGKDAFVDLERLAGWAKIIR